MKKTQDTDTYREAEATKSRQRVFVATQTFPPCIGGMENTMHALARNLAGSGFDVTVLPNHSYKSPEAFRVINVPLIKPLRIITKRLLLKLMLKNDDTVICDSWKSVNTVTRRFCGRLVLLAHGQEYLKNDRHDRRIQKALNRATLIVANSDFTANLIKDRFDFPPEKLKIIPPTYMLEMSAHPNDKSRKTNGHIRLVSICRLDKRKGLKEAIEAISKADVIKDQWRWHIVGNGVEARPLKKVVKDLQLENNIRFLHDITDADKPKIMEDADLFVMPSYRTGESVEGFGISYIEAAQYGIPAIAGNSDGSANAVIDGETGWCVDAQNGEQLKRVLTTAINSREERERRGVAAYDRFVNEFLGARVFETFVQNMMKEEGE